MTKIIDRFIQTICALPSANAANVSLTFALGMLPIVGAAGAAVDYSQANSVKAAMQAAADLPTALMLAKTVGAGTLSKRSDQPKSQRLFLRLAQSKGSVRHSGQHHIHCGHQYCGRGYRIGKNELHGHNGNVLDAGRSHFPIEMGSKLQNAGGARAGQYRLDGGVKQDSLNPATRTCRRPQLRRCFPPSSMNPARPR